MSDERPQPKMLPPEYYKVEYPFQAIDATMRNFAIMLEQESGHPRHTREQLTSGSVLYKIFYPGLTLELAIQALDTRLCVLTVRMPDDGTGGGAQLRKILNGIVTIHEDFIASVENAETLIPTDRTTGGRETWPEDAEAVARLQAGEERAEIRRDWLKQAARNRKRKKLTDPDNRFRQLVVKAKKG